MTGPGATRVDKRHLVALEGWNQAGWTAEPRRIHRGGEGVRWLDQPPQYALHPPTEKNSALTSLLGGVLCVVQQEQQTEGVYCVETLECGVWEMQDVADSWEDAVMLASSLCCTSLPEDRIRISTPESRVL